MRPTLEALLRRGPQTASALLRDLDVSQPTLSRQIAGTPQILMMGRARATRYGWRRSLRELPSAFPLYRIDTRGSALELGRLHAVHGGWWFEDDQQPQNNAWFDGLPWFLADMRPQGFLGTGFAQRHSELQLPERLSDWQDDHVVYALARRGEDASGNLIIGEESFARWAGAESTAAIPAASRARRYPRLADAALAGEHGGSSAGGEQPKFAAVIDEPTGPRHVLVKFTESLETAAGQRWADLLIAEHHALERIRAEGVPAAMSQIVQAGGRLFLEVCRFDRPGIRGRRGLISMSALDDEFVGERRHWLHTAQALLQQRRLSSDDVKRIAWLQSFGELIGNTDMHFGNLSMHYEGQWPVELAPAYDMLPMLYAPRRSDVRTPPFRPAAPVSGALQMARSAKSAAQMFWSTVAADRRISEAFRVLCQRNAEILETLGW